MDGSSSHSATSSRKQTWSPTRRSTKASGTRFLEAVYHKRPIVCNRYTIYRTDIEPCGFRSVVFDGFITHETVEGVRRVLSDADYRQEMVEHNYQVANRFFSYEVPGGGSCG